MGSACHSFHGTPDVHTGEFREREGFLSSQNVISGVEGKKLPQWRSCKSNFPLAAPPLLSKKKFFLRLVVTLKQPQIKNCSTQIVSNATTPSWTCGGTFSPWNSSPGFRSFLPFAGIIFKAALCSFLILVEFQQPPGSLGGKQGSDGEREGFSCSRRSAEKIGIIQAEHLEETPRGKG